MEIKKNIDQNMCVLSLTGRLTGCNEADELYLEFKKLRDEDVRSVILDLKDLEWMGSMGLGALIGCLTSMRNVKGDLRLANPNQKVAHLLHITRLDGIFQVYGSVSDAKSSFSTFL